MADVLLQTTVVGSYPQPDWLVDRKMLSKVVPRTRMREIWRVSETFLEQAQDDATLIAIRDMERAGLAWSDIGLVEIHEAFAAQVLSNVQAWGSKASADRLGLPGPVGEVNWDVTNVLGGSIAIGHPFGATGARIVTTLANEMHRRDVQFGLISICAQGGMGFAMVLERA